MYPDDITDKLREDTEKKLVPDGELASLMSQPIAKRAGTQPTGPVGPTKSDDKEDRDFFSLSDLFKQAAGGVMDAGNEVIDMADMVWDWAGKNWDLLNDYWSEHDDILGGKRLPTAGAATSTVGSFVRPTAQFLTGFIPAMGALRGVKAVSFLGKAAKAATAGAMADFAVFDGTEARLSNFVQSVPALANPITEYLSADEDDSELEGRLKNVIEGMAMGGLAEGLFGALRAFKGKLLKHLGAEGTKEFADKFATKNADIKLDTTKGFKDIDSEGIPVVNLEINEAEAMKIASPNFKADPAKVFKDFNYKRLSSTADVDNSVMKLSEVIMEKRPGMLTDGVKSEKHTRALAKALGIRPDQVLKNLEAGVPTEHLDGYIVAIKEMIDGNYKEMQKTLKLINKGDDSTIARAELLKLTRQQAYLMSKAKGTSRDIARGLNACKYVARGTDNMPINKEALDLLIENNGGTKASDELINKLTHLSALDETKANKMIWDSFKAKTSDAIHYYWVNSLLSGPTTQMVNIMSTGLAVGGRVLETGMAAGRNLFRKGGDVTFGEVGARVHGLLHSFREGLGVAWQAFKQGQDQFEGMTKFDFNGESLSKTLNLPGTLGKASEVVGTVIGAPGRALVSMDNFFKTLQVRSELHAMAYREAQGRTFLNPAERAMFVKDFVQSPTKINYRKALEEARMVTFQQELGKGGKALTNAVHKIPGLRYAMPFVRTPTNLLKYVGQRTPIIGKMGATFKADIAAGGARAEMAQAKLAVGQMYFGAATLLASAGMIEGGADKQQRGANKLINRLEYTIRFGDKQFSFSRLDPFGSFLGVAADMVEMAQHLPDDDYNEYATSMMLMFSRNLMSKTYLKGLTDMLNALQDPDRFGEGWLANFMGSFVPNFINQTNKAFLDQQIKDVNTIGENFRKRIPGWSEGVIPKRNPITGEPAMYGESWWASMSPMSMTQESSDPTLRELHRLEYGLEAPSQRLTINGKQVDLTAKEYEEYQIAITNLRDSEGLTMFDRLKKLMDTKVYQEMFDGKDKKEGKQKMITRMIQAYRRSGKGQFLQNNPQILERLQ
jgi:hypothetical protein